MTTPKIVVTLHGIRTRGNWQKEITPYLARYGVVPYHLDYGWFGVVSFILPWARQKKVQWLRNELRDLMDRSEVRRISVIAHSFGTYLITEALESENGGFLFDRVVLTGSIVRRDYPWEVLIEKKKLIASVRNERAAGDRIVKLAEWAAKYLPGACRAGSTGADGGFSSQPQQLIEHTIDGGHSEVMNRANYSKWARFIAYPTLCDEHLALIVTQLEYLTALVVSKFGVSKDCVRTNLFTRVAGKLRMVPDAWTNMTHAPEHTIELDTDHGCTGRAFTERTPFFVTRQGSAWNSGLLPTSEDAKLNPRLSWVLSFPLGELTIVKGKMIAKSPIGVLNIDGLDMVPGLLQAAQSAPSDLSVELDDFLKVLWVQTAKVYRALLLATTGDLPDDN